MRLLKPGKRLSRILAAAAATAMAIGLAGCSMDSGSGTADPGSESKEIVFFTLPSSIQYVDAQARAFEAEAERLGYTTKFIVNEFDSGQETQQIQQFVASGEKPAAIVLWAVDIEAGVTQAAQLSEVAPTFQINFKVAEGGFDYVKAWVGPDDVLIGQTAGENIIALRDQLKEEGAALHSEGGNLLIIGAEPGGISAIDRFKGLSEVLEGSGIQVLQHVDCCSDTQGAYEAATQLLPKWKSQVDFIFTQNGETASGIIKAAKENGLTPGVDVRIVSGNCGGPRDILESGELSAAGQQLAGIEGAAMAQTIERYLRTGEVRDVTESIEYSETIPEIGDEPPAKINVLPNPTLDKSTLDDLVWDQPIAALCPLY